MIQLDDNGTRMRIGDVAERTGLSIRTIRYYEEAGLVAPSTRTTGGFRLYSPADSERLELIKRMKPLGFTVDEMRELLQALDALAEQPAAVPGHALEGQLERLATAVDERCGRLREQAAAAGGLALLLRERATFLTTEGGQS